MWIADCLETDKCDGYAEDKYICYHGKQLDQNHKVYSLHTLYTYEMSDSTAKLKAPCAKKNFKGTRQLFFQEIEIYSNYCCYTYMLPSRDCNPENRIR